MQRTRILQPTPAHTKHTNQHANRQPHPRHPPRRTIQIRRTRVIMRIKPLIHLRHTRIRRAGTRHQRGIQQIFHLSIGRPPLDPTFVERRGARRHRHDERVGETRVTPIVRPVEHTSHTCGAFACLQCAAHGEPEVLGHVARHPYAGHVGLGIAGDQPDHTRRHVIR